MLKPMKNIKNILRSYFQYSKETSIFGSDISNKEYRKAWFISLAGITPFVLILIVIAQKFSFEIFIAGIWICIILFFVAYFWSRKP